MKYLFVCTGNTCRSPMAEGIFNKIAAERGAEDFAESAGIFAEGGVAASQNSIDAMREIGIDISEHRAKRITGEMLGEYGKILTMTAVHAELLRGMFPQFAEIVSTLGAAAEEDGGIPDPFGGDLNDYRICRDEIKRLIEKLWEKR